MTDEQKISAEAHEDAHHEEFLEADEFMQEQTSPTWKVLAGSMPWVVSLLFHVGIFLIMLFIVMITTSSEAEEIDIPTSTNISENVGVMKAQQYTKSNRDESRPPRKNNRESKLTDLKSRSERKPIHIPTVGGASSGGGPIGKTGLEPGNGNSKGGPKFWGEPAGCPNVIFVIDRSGSMIDAFDSVRKEMVRSISKMGPKNTFHVIMFETGKPLAMESTRVMPANFRNKRNAAKFLMDILAVGQTDPVPALDLAFKLIKTIPRVQKDPKRRSAVIYLLTDGIFPDNSAVLKTIAKHNKKGKVKICTFLYGQRPAEAVSIMTKIAKENNGTFKFVKHDE